MHSQKISINKPIKTGTDMVTIKQYPTEMIARMTMERATQQGSWGAPILTGICMLILKMRSLKTRFSGKIPTSMVGETITAGSILQLLMNQMLEI